ncbi:hypothetical protein VTO42DRAFT_4941 [Malbranchea cinnamomea]
MFTPVDTALGAILLHQGASGLLQHNGRVFGISSLLSGCLGQPSLDNVPIILGLASSVAPVYLFAPSLLPSLPPAPVGMEAALATAGTGFLVGWGTKNDHGCTSGHMFCGLSRLSVRSLIATGIFFTTALVTANLGFKLATPIPSCGSQPCYTPTYPSRDQLLFMIAAVAMGQLTNSVLVPRVLRRSNDSAALYSYVAGLQFGLGLLISGMANPAKVLGFFSWFDLKRLDPSLALVILFGVVPTLLSYLKLKREHGLDKGETKKPPTLVDRFRLPTATVADIDWRFVAGAAAFGVGWGLCGVCPGPAILRSILQPAWGALWMGGFWLGSHIGL